MQSRYTRDIYIIYTAHRHARVRHSRHCQLRGRPRYPHPRPVHAARRVAAARVLGSPGTRGPARAGPVLAEAVAAPALRRAALQPRVGEVVLLAPGDAGGEVPGAAAGGAGPEVAVSLTVKEAAHVVVSPRAELLAPGQGRHQHHGQPAPQPGHGSLPGPWVLVQRHHGHRHLSCQLFVSGPGQFKISPPPRCNQQPVVVRWSAW